MNKLKYRKAWSWPQQVEDFMASRAQGFCVHIMNGASTLGDLRIDKFTNSTDITADALYLPLKDEIADSVLCDPPWGMDYILKPKLMRELYRVLKFGGFLIFNAPWCPKSPGLELLEIWCPTYQLMTYTHISLIFLLRKIRRNMFVNRCTQHTS